MKGRMVIRTAFVYNGDIMISYAALAASLNGDLNMGEIRRYAAEVSQVISANAENIGDNTPMPAEAAMHAVNQCQEIIADVNKFNDEFYASLCEIGELGEESDNEEDTVSASYIDNIYLCAQIVKGDIVQLESLFKLAKSTPAWRPHSAILAILERDAILSMTRLQHTIKDTAIMLRQHLDSIPHADEDMQFSEEEIASFKKAVSDSHKALGMEMPKWM
ncbi:TPA: hypothetical protein SMG93_005326 [Klebsiella oxytoca]|nr:hypothetical protein [Klebsiella oxytoca]